MSLVFDVNNLPAGGAEAMYSFKELLKAATWIHQASSDGLTFTTTPGNINDKLTGFGTGVGGFNNASAWIVMQQPTGGAAPFSGTRQICLQRTSTGGGNGDSWRIKYSMSAGFTGGSPSAIRTPSATDEGILWGGGTDASPTFAQLFGAGERWHACADDASPFGFWSASYSAGLLGKHGFMMDPMLAGTFPIEDVEPYGFYVDWTTANPGAWDRTRLATETIRMWYDKGGPFERFVTDASALVPISATTTTAIPVGVNPHNGQDDLILMPYARRANLAAGGPSGHKGFSRWLHWNGVTRVADTLSVLSSKDHIIIHMSALPWDGSTPI
jgi:hypothetical protein